MEVPGLSVVSSRTEGCLWEGEFFFIADSAIFKNFKESGVGV